MGMLYGQEDMPFSAQGITPDIIINPHAVPGRMTAGQLIECIMGKACAVTGSYGDATPFSNMSVHEIGKILEEQCGMNAHGNELLYNGRTGEQMKVSIFMDQLTIRD